MIAAAEIQPIVLRPPVLDHATVVFLRFGGPSHDARARLRRFLLDASLVLGEQAEAPRPDRTVNLGLTASAIRLLGVDARMQSALSPEFMAGMRAAATRIGDSETVVKDWEPPFDTESQVHAALVVHSATPAAPLADLLPPRLGVADEVPSDVVATWRGAREGTGFARDHEPFGFRDNITDPAIEGVVAAPAPGNGIWDPSSRTWRPVRTGEAVLGYVDESGSVAGHPDAAQLLRNASFLVLRKLEQDVDGFLQRCETLATELGTTPDLVAAQMMGRHRDGRPLGYEGEDWRFNDFLYGDDGSRARIPMSAHIRRANPRDDMPFADKIVSRHQVFRRGLPYCDESNGSARTGLLFMACCADIRRQFEFVQKHWLQDGNRFGLGVETDPITGRVDAPLLSAHEDTSTGDGPVDADGRPVAAPPPSLARRISLDVDGARREVTVASFVTPRGGEYFLLPSVSALHLLGCGELTDDQQGRR